MEQVPVFVWIVKVIEGIRYDERFSVAKLRIAAVESDGSTACGGVHAICSLVTAWGLVVSISDKINQT